MKRPLTNINLFRLENYGIDISELLEACNPSLPAIPIPTYAVFIMGKSLNPSPTAAVVSLG